jgi:erythromycin esterase-like protein
VLHTAFTATRELAHRLDGATHDYDALLEAAADRRFVLLGEATHGTREFYRMRAEITRRLIEELDFDAVAIEGDWPDVWRVHRYVTGVSGETATAALGDFERFPMWMWRNCEMRSFVEWLRDYNAARPATRRVGVYGLDLYSLYRSADAVVRYLQSVDPDQAAIAQQRYAALDHVRDPQHYGYEAAMRLRPTCREGALQQLQTLRTQAQTYRAVDGLAALDAQFVAERNAAVVVTAEEYYRAMFGSRVNTWNLRDTHMHDTLMALAQHRRRCGGSGRIAVWAHNSHLGDARATEMHHRGEWNLGQLLRQDVGPQALLVGFTTYTGEVTAASGWDREVERKRVRPALSGSCEQLFHSTHLDRFYLPLHTPRAAPLHEFLLQRAIGVIYLPLSERRSHYFDAAVAAQFDAIFHLDETQALEPLEPSAVWHAGESVPG